MTEIIRSTCSFSYFYVQIPLFEQKNLLHAESRGIINNFPLMEEKLLTYAEKRAITEILNLSNLTIMPESQIIVKSS